MNNKLTINPDKSVTLETEIIKYQLASFWERFAARIIDVLIILIPNMIIPIIPGWLYWSLQHSSKKQATIGQKTLGIQIVSLNGSRVSFGQATGRFFANWLNLFTFFIGYLMFFSSYRNQCLHDNLSECIVVKEVDRVVKAGISV